VTSGRTLVVAEKQTVQTWLQFTHAFLLQFIVIDQTEAFTGQDFGWPCWLFRGLHGLAPCYLAAEAHRVTDDSDQHRRRHCSTNVAQLHWRPLLSSRRCAHLEQSTAICNSVAISADFSEEIEEVVSVICQLEECIIEIGHWMSASRLKLNTHMAELVWTGSRHNLSLPPWGCGPSLQLGDDVMKPSSYVRLLGVTIAADLGLDRYVSNVYLWLQQLRSVRRSPDIDSERH